MTWEIKQGHVLEVLRSMPDQGCQVIATSPPYYAQRAYRISDQVWGGTVGCQHQWGNSLPAHHPGQVEQSKWKQAEAAGKGQTAGAGQFCLDCGAWKGQLGLEPTPQLFVEHLTEIFMECARILRDDGLMFINIADSYVGGGKAGSNPDYKQRHVNMGKVQDLGTYPSPPKIPPGLRAKSLVGVPWRLALSLIDRGLILRNSITWVKGCSFLDSWAGAVMPSSARDRFTVSTEEIFMFSKSPHYFFDMHGVLEQGTFPAGTKAAKGSGTREGNRRPTEYAIYSGTRQPRSAWAIPTEPSKSGHYAQWPKQLVGKMVQCATPDAGCCSSCGTPWTRKLTRQFHGEHNTHEQAIQRERQLSPGGKTGVTLGVTQFKSIIDEGWQPGCSCNAPTVPAIVCDIFAGTGTTLAVAETMGRDSIGIELGDEYIEIAKEKIARILAAPETKKPTKKRPNKNQEATLQLSLL